MLIGVVVLGATLTEGAGNDWIAKASVDGLGAEQSTGALLFAAFVLAMTAMRFFGGRAMTPTAGGRCPRQHGRGRSGLCLFVFSGTIWLAAAGAVLWGVGAALAFPIGMSAAADDPRKAAARVSVVSTLGYIAFLAGPPLLGYLGDVTGIRPALLAIGIPILVALLLAGAVKPLPPGKEPGAPSCPAFGGTRRWALRRDGVRQYGGPMRTMLRKTPGRRVSNIDLKIVRAVSKLPGGGHDDFFRRLSAAANNGKLWFGIAGVMALVPGKTRRAALHGSSRKAWHRQ